ncbi:MAG: YfhO family protein, partial [Rhodothermia bacterium]|nr:YfhO family protein [Rhodothermia bacterium]
GVDRRYFDESKLTRASSIESEIPQFEFDRYILEQEANSTERFRVLSLEGSPTTTARPSFFHESLSGYHGAKLRLYQDFLDQILITPEGGLNTQALRMMNTRYVVARGPVPDSRLVFTDEQTGFGVYEVNDYLPRAFLVDSIVVLESAESTWSFLRDDSLDLRRVAVTTKDLELGYSDSDSTSAGSAFASVRTHTPRHIEIDVETDRKRLLVLSEVFYPAGWTATIDGDAVEIERVNYLLRGVIVPPGEHEVIMSFDPSSHRIGLWVAGVASILVYGLMVVIVGYRIVQSRSDGTQEHAG